MTASTLTPERLRTPDTYWRAANHLSVGQVYLYDNPVLKRPLTLADVKRMLLGHWRASALPEDSGRQCDRPDGAATAQVSC